MPIECFCCMTKPPNRPSRQDSERPDDVLRPSCPVVLSSSRPHLRRSQSCSGLCHPPGTRSGSRFGRHHIQDRRGAVQLQRPPQLNVQDFRIQAGLWARLWAAFQRRPARLSRWLTPTRRWRSFSGITREKLGGCPHFLYGTWPAFSWRRA